MDFYAELIRESKRIPKPTRGYIVFDNIASKSEIDEIIEQFDNTQLNLKPIFILKLLDLGDRKRIVHTKIIPFLERNIENDNEEIRNLALKSLRHIIFDYTKNPIMNEQIENMSKNEKFIHILKSIVVNKTEKATSRDSAIGILFHLNPEEVFDSLIQLLENGDTLFIPEEGIKSYLLELYKVLPKKDRFYEHLKFIFENSPHEQSRNIAKAAIARASN